jgi:hypothetical protein
MPGRVSSSLLSLPRTRRLHFFFIIIIIFSMFFLKTAPYKCSLLSLMESSFNQKANNNSPTVQSIFLCYLSPPPPSLFSPVQMVPMSSQSSSTTTFNRTTCGSEREANGRIRDGRGNFVESSDDDDASARRCRLNAQCDEQ